MWVSYDVRFSFIFYFIYIFDSFYLAFEILVVSKTFLIMSENLEFAGTVEQTFELLLHCTRQLAVLVWLLFTTRIGVSKPHDSWLVDYGPLLLFLR